MITTKLEELMTYIESTGIKPTNEVYYTYIIKFSISYPIKYLCKLMGVGKSSYYDWQKKTKQVDPDIKIRDMILEIRVKKHKDTMGYRMVTKYLHVMYDVKINHKKVYRIMKKYGLLSASWHSKKMNVLYRGIQPYSNLVKRGFYVNIKNSIWCIDITKIDSHQGRQYLCAIIDLYDRAIVGYKIYKNQTVGLVKKTIESAIKYEDLSSCPKLVLHSDQGRVFKASTYIKDFLKETPVIQSMGEMGSPCENSVIESFFANLKKERLYLDEFETHEDVALAVIDYIYWYNRIRPHSYNGCSPHEKRYPLK